MVNVRIIASPPKSHLLPIVWWEVWGQEYSSIIAKLAPDCEINIEAVSSSKLYNQPGCLGREGNGPCCHSVPWTELIQKIVSLALAIGLHRTQSEQGL